MGRKRIMKTRKGKKQKVMASTCKEGQLSKKSQVFLEFSTKLFGELVADYTRERLMKLSESMQEDLICHVLHYVYSDQIMTTGNPEVDIMLMEIVAKLPYFSLQVVQFMRRYPINKMNSDSDSSGYIN